MSRVHLPMNAHRLPDDEPRDTPRNERGRDDMLRLVRQRLSQTPRVVRLRGRSRSAVGGGEPVVAQPASPGSGRD